eukprot:14547-Heterococcus_DN1.PRE.3
MRYAHNDNKNESNAECVNTKALSLQLDAAVSWPLFVLVILRKPSSAAMQRLVMQQTTEKHMQH